MRGFTLVEMIVAIGIFSMVSTLAIGSLLILTSAERQVSSVQINQDNVRFAIESMSREIRTGIQYRSCSFMSLEEGCFMFNNALNKEVTYCRGKKVGEGSYECNENGGLFLRKPDASGLLNPLTTEDIEVGSLIFKLFGDSISDQANIAQPRVTVFLSATALKGQKNETKMDIQTTISQLMLDKIATPP